MAEITRLSTASCMTLTPDSGDCITGLLAGEDLLAAQAAYVKSSDGKVYKSTGAAANAAAKVRGFVFIPADAGEAVTLVKDVNFYYGSSLTPGADLYLSGSVAGGLADAASTGGTAPVGYVVDAAKVHLYESRY